MTQDLGTVDPDSVECQVPILIWHYMLYSPLRTSSSGMVYKDAEKLYGEVRADATAVVDNALCVLYLGSVSRSSAATTPASLCLGTIRRHSLGGTSCASHSPRAGSAPGMCYRLLAMARRVTSS